MSATCVLTGCIFVDPYQGKSIRGDLHELGSCYIFNASGCEWEYESPHDSQRQIASETYYEKNKVIVFEQDTGTFNAAAVEYLGEKDAN